jgi:hypothetical protein
MASVTDVIIRYLKQPWRLAVPLKRIGIVLLLLGFAVAGYYWSIKNLRFGDHLIISLLIVWLATAYYLLPRVHRFLSNIYLPNYFIGRARTADGLLADPVNLSLRGDKKMLIDAMHKAGWQEADPITLKSAWRIAVSTLRRRSYPNAPVSDLFVFGKKQDLAFQKEVDANPAKRHHVRFWSVAKDVYLPGGYDVDWVAAATYDDAVGFSIFTLQITHSIDGDVDAERDFLVDTLKKARRTKSIQRIEYFFPEYTHRNGGGHSYFTDGSMVIVDLKKGWLK